MYYNHRVLRGRSILCRPALWAVLNDPGGQFSNIPNPSPCRSKSEPRQFKIRAAAVQNIRNLSPAVQTPSPGVSLQK